MTARSFERYVIGKLEDQGYESDYLANIVKESSSTASNELSDYPYPLAVEMDVENKAYDGLFDTLQVKETDKGLALFRKEAPSTVYSKGKRKPKGMSVGEAEAVVKRLKQWVAVVWLNRLYCMLFLTPRKPSFVRVKMR